MGNANLLLGLIKQSAVEAVEAGKPTYIVFGTVTSASPLKITVEQKLTLTNAQLVLTRNVTDYDVSMTVNHQTEPAGARSHSHDVTTTTGSGNTDQDNAPNHTHKYKGKKTFTVHNALKAGEDVLLIRQQNGQKYIVIDRIGVIK